VRRPEGGRAADLAPKYEEELAFWRALIKGGGAEAAFGEPFERAFERLHRVHLELLGSYLGLGGESTIDAWCRERSAVEIGGGPFPAITAVRHGWRRAAAVDPLARAYAEEGLLVTACESVVHVEAPGERVPLPGGFADLVVIENCLDHVDDPAAVVAEMSRLLRPGGLVWLFVDLSTHVDAMHPHPMTESRLTALMAAFEHVRGGATAEKAHPEAYGAYRGLWRKRR
jgi:SAM-dependent methyltransferase